MGIILRLRACTSSTTSVFKKALFLITLANGYFKRLLLRSYSDVLILESYGLYSD